MKILPIFVIAFLTFTSCKEKNKSIYENCCGTEATVDSFRFVDPLYDSNGNLIDSTRSGYIFIPNVFVPDNSSIFSQNTEFVIGVGVGTASVISLIFTDVNTDTLFQKENFSPFDPEEESWNGEKANGDLYFGLFNYRIEIELIDGQIKTYIGKACSLNCGDKTFPSNNIPNCFFPSQHDGNGGSDPSLPSSQECF